MMRAQMFRFPLFCVLMFCFPVVVMSAGQGQVAGNSVDFDPPPKGGANPDSPAIGEVTATGVTTSANGYMCMAIGVTLTEAKTLNQVDKQMKGGGAKWQYAKTKLTTSGTHFVGVSATWSGPMGKTDDAVVSQSVTVK